MERRSLLFVVVAAALLALPAAAAAHPLPQRALQAHGAPATICGPVRATARLSPSFALTGTGVLSVTVQDSHGAAQSGAGVTWSVWGSSDYGTGSGTTNASGLVTLSNVATASGGDGEIQVAGDTYYYDVTNMDWPGTGPTSYTFEPARQAVSFTRQSGSPWTQAFVDVFTSDGTGDKVSQTIISGTAATVSGTADVLPGTTTGAAVYFYSDEGAELNIGSITAVAGTDTGSPLSCDETNDTQYTGFLDWSSGKPGSKEKLHLGGFPAGWVNKLSGYDGDTYRPSTWSSSWTSTGVSGTKVVTVPSTIKPGHTYVFDVQHSNGVLDLNEAYQVCTLNASSASIHKGQSVRLSGVVPAAGSAKRLVLYKRTTSAGRPSKNGGPASVSGWTRVGYAKSSGKGAYSKSVAPTRTTYYVVWYPSDSTGHWAAYTAVRKVTVR